MKKIQSLLVAAVIAISSFEANCEQVRYEFDGVVSLITSQSNLPNRINVGDAIRGHVDMESNLAPPPWNQSYLISPSTQDWIEAEVSVGGVTYSTEGLIGSSGSVFVMPYSDSYTVFLKFVNPASTHSSTAETVLLDVNAYGRQMPSLSNIINGISLEQNFTWNREPNNFDPPTGSFDYIDEYVAYPAERPSVFLEFSLQRIKVGLASTVDLTGSIKTPDGSDICAMVLASGQFMFSCNPSGVLSLPNLPREPDGTVKRQIYADGFFPKIHILPGSTDIPVVLTRSGTCPSYNASYDPGFVPGSAGKQIYIAGKVLVQDSPTPICAIVLANGQYTFSCDGTGSYALKIPLNTNGQYKLQVYADGFAPTIQTFDEFKTTNNVRMARAAECTQAPQPLPVDLITYFNDVYPGREEKKAIALALDTNGRRSWGASYGYSSQDLANDRALSTCKDSIPINNVNADCRLYAIGEYVVW